MAKRMLSLLLAAVMLLGMLPAMNLAASAEETAQTAPTPLWSEDFQSETTGEDYSGAKLTVNNNTPAIPHHYNLDIAEDAGDKYLHVTYNEEAYTAYSEANSGSTKKYGFYARSTAFSKTTDAMVLNFSVKFDSDPMNTFIIRLFDSVGNNVFSLLFSSGSVTYTYTGSTPWSNAITDITTKSVSLEKDKWHDLQLVLIQRGSEEKDYWALLENGKILIELEGDHYFRENQANNPFAAVDFYVQTASNNVQIYNTYLDDLAVYEYVPATGIAFTESEYTVNPGGKTQTAVVVTPGVTYPNVKATYTTGDSAIAVVDENGRITGVAAGTTTVKATITIPDGSGTTLTGKATVTVAGGKVLWDSDFDSDELTAADDNLNYQNVNSEKWSARSDRSYNGGYSVKIAADAQDPSDHYLCIQPGAATDAVVGTYNYLSSAFADAAAIDVQFNLQLHEDENGYRDNITLRLHPKSATQGGIMDVVFKSNGTVWAQNSTLNTNGYTISKEDAAAGLNVRIVAIQNAGTEYDRYRVYINGILALEGSVFGASVGSPYSDYAFQMITIKNDSAAAGVFTNTDTRIDDLIVYEYTPVLATGITLDRDSANLQTGKTLQLNATVAPANVDACKVTYASDKEAVATVSETGLITAVAAGTATITATVTNPDSTYYTDTVTVTVPEADPNLLWGEDFENWDGTLDGLKQIFTLTNRTAGQDHYYGFTASEEDGNTSLHIAYDPALNTENTHEKYGFYMASPKFEAADAAVLNFSTMFSASEKNAFQILLLDSSGSGLFTLQIDNGTITYAYGGTTWSYTFTDVTQKSAQITAGEWHDLQLVLIQRSGEGETDYWALLEDGEILLQHEGSHSFGSNAGFGQIKLYVQTAAQSGAVQVYNTWLDDLAVYKYIPVSGVTLDAESYAVKAGETVQATATVTPDVIYPTVKPVYSTGNANIATVDANGKITGVGGGTTTITATVTNSDGTVKTDSATVTVDATALNLLWSDDFEDSAITAEDAQYINTEKWQVTNNNSYNFRVVQDPNNENNKMLHITAGPETTDSTTAFNYASISFAGKEVTEFSFDVILSKDAAGYQDNFQFSLGTSTSQALVIILLERNGTIRYSTTSSNTWSTSSVGTVSAGEKHTFRLVVVQKEGTDSDLWQLWMDGQLLTQQTSFIPSGTSDNVPVVAKLHTSTGSNGRYTAVDTYIDNMQVRTFTPVPATELEAAELEVEVGKNAALTVTVGPEDAGQYLLSYVSGNSEIATVDANGAVMGVAEGQTSITVTLTNVDGTTLTKTVQVSVIPLNPLVWEEDFDDKQVGSTGGFTVVNNNPELGSISVQDATGKGGTDNALVLERESGGEFALNGSFKLPATSTKMVLEYKVMDMHGGHINTVLPTLANANSNSARFVSLFINGGTLYYNTGEAFSVQVLNTKQWYTIKLVIDTENTEWQLYVDNKFMASGEKMLYGNTGDVSHVYFQASPEDQSMSGGVWMDDFKVMIYKEIDGLNIVEESITIDGQQSKAITVDTTPADATGHIIYTSSDETIAIVDGNGVVTGVTPGTVTITAATYEGFSDTVQVTINHVAPTSVTVDQQTLNLPVGAHTYLNAVAFPDYATPNTVSFASSDETIVTVDEYGEVVCLKAGTAKLLLKAGDVTVEVPVTVTAAGVMKQIYVAPNGSDTAAGTSGDPASLTRALELIAASNDNMTGNIEVILVDSGYYYLTETLVMTEAHGGTNGYSVVWKAAEGKTPIISGAKHIDGSLFKDEDRDGIYTINLGSLEIPAVSDPDTMSTTRQLFVNNVRATRARSEGGLTDATYWKDGSTHIGHISSDVYLAQFDRVQDLEFVYQELWSNPRCGVTSITDNEDGTVSIEMDQPGWKYCAGKGNSAAGSDGPVWIENALELLDEPGEWYLNEETQILYYMPRSWETMSEVTVTLPLLDDYDIDGNGVAGLISIAGTDYDNMVHNISFEGITFADTTWTRPSTLNGHSETQNNHIRETTDYLPDAAITVTKANGICFTGCTFTRLGITAVKMVKGVQNSHFVGNHFYDISGGAINIGDPSTKAENANPSDKRALMKNCDVLNNYIHDIGVDFNSAAAISLGYGPDMNFSYNEIFNMPYSGFHIGYGWTVKFPNVLKNLEISNNFIHDFMGDGVADGGGVYTIGNTSGDGYNKVHHNYVKTVLDDSGPLYMDNGATYYEVYKNVVDLSKVTDWSGNTSISWLQLNAGAHHLYVHDNYTTVYKYNNYATESEVEPGHVETAGQWSAEAQEIIDGAGLQSDYSDLRNGHAELIVTDLADESDMNVDDTFQIHVSYTDGKDQPVSGGEYILAFDSKNPDIVEVSETGELKALKKGSAVIRIWVVSNDILDIVEKTVYVEDEIEEVYLESYRGYETLTMSDESDGITLKTAVKMVQGRILNPAEECVTYAVADESVVKIVDGVLTPVGLGSTTLTVKVNMDGLTGEVTYNVEITLAKTFEVDYLEDLFNSEKSDWTNSDAASIWEQVEDTSLTTKINGWTTYSGRTYENELLTFKLKLDTTDTGGWPCFVIRANSNEMGPVGGGASSYVLCFGNEAKGIELQRWNGVNRTMIIGTYSDYVPVSNIYHLPHNVDDGQEHLIQFGAMTDGGTTRLVLYVDGEKMFDFLDTSADAITSPGYFGIVGRNEIYYLSHASAEDSYFTASVGGDLYKSLNEALDAAEEGETVKLLADLEESGVLVKNGISLDLNGHKLTADYVVGFTGSQMLDSIGEGLLKCENVQLDVNNETMPVWVKVSDEEAGYRFFTVVDYQKYRWQEDDSFQFISKPAAGAAANDGLIAEAAVNGHLTVKMRLSWTNTSGNEVEQNFTMKKEDVYDVYTVDEYLIQLTVTGTANYKGLISTTTVIESDTGVVWAATAQPYTGVQAE